MEVSQIVARLEAVSPLRLRAIELLMRLDRALAADGDQTVDTLCSQNEIEGAIQELEAQAAKADQVVERCKQLSPIPSTTLPPGF